MLQILLLFLAIIGVAAAFISKDQGYNPWWGLGFAIAMLLILAAKVIAAKRRESSEDISITQ